MRKFNNEQLQVINSNSDRILCLAAAGSGKTTVLLNRISRLVKDGVAPSSILALTFTNAAAAEMKSRYEAMHIGEETPEFRTFHSFCYSILCKDSNIRQALGYEGIPTIVSEEQEKEIETKALTQCKITLSKEKLRTRVGLTRQEIFQAELYDKAVTRLMRSENIITFDRLNSDISELFASGHSSTKYYVDKYRHICCDECLTEDMGVLTDNGWYRINRLYDDYIAGNPLPLVKSYNITNSEYEYKPIIGALKSENRDIWEIRTEGLNKIRCTLNHMIYTQRGYVPVSDLIIGEDMVILDSPDKQKTKYLLNSDQYQICLGSYLGDGHLDRMSKFYTYRLQITQGIKQQDYFMSKISAFNLEYHRNKSGYTGETSILSSNPTPVFALKMDIFNCVLSDISPLGLAIWYQDDGSLNSGYSAVISTGSFSEEQNKILVNMLKNRFNLDAASHVDSRGYCYIRFNAKNSDKFFKLISPYMHPSMQYKTPIDISNNAITYNSSYRNVGANFVSEISYVGTATVYDLTIEDNHNFITSKSTHRVDNKTGIIVHNCQDTDSVQMKFLDAFKESNFMLVGDTLQNIYSFRGTSNEFIKLLANAPGWEVIKLFTNYRSTNQICEYTNKFSAKYADDSYRIEMKGTRDGERVVTKMTDGPAKYSYMNPRDLEDVLKELDKLSGTSAILCRTNKEVAAVTSYLKTNDVDFTTSKDNQIQPLIDCSLSDTFALGYLASYLPSNKYGEYIRLCTQIQKPTLDWFLKLYGTVPQVKDVIKDIITLREISENSEFTNTKLAAIEKAFHLKNINKTDIQYSGKKFLLYLRDAISDVKSSELYVGTIHSVKGLEYDNVFVMNVGSYNFRLNSEDEKNLFYVAVTRAKDRLFVYELFADY